MPKRKFQGIFNWQGEVHELWTTEHTENAARENLFTQLARRVGTTTYAVRQYFLSKGNSFEVKLKP
jgi:hypothetical protein